MGYPRNRFETWVRVGMIGLGAAALAMTAACSSGPQMPRIRRAAAAESQPTIGVNAFLWRASLDTLAFMSLANADPYGGVITYDWYANPEKPDERFKATVYILDTRLRADGLNVAINRQVKNGADWVEAPTAADTEDQIENAILLRARQLRISGR